MTEGPGSSIVVSFDSNVFSISAVKRAAYRLSAKFAVEIQVIDSNIDCRISLPPDIKDIDVEEVKRSFRVEVLDSDLREMISNETAAERTAILAYAFSATGIQKE